MAWRPQLTPQLVITNGNMSGNLTSLVTIIQKISMPSYQVVWSGTSPVGTLSVQVSNDYALNPNGTVENAGTWSTLYLNYQGSVQSTVPVSGNSGSEPIDILQTGFYAMRLIYTFGSGVGTMNATISGKVS